MILKINGKIIKIESEIESNVINDVNKTNLLTFPDTFNNNLENDQLESLLKNFIVICIGLGFLPILDEIILTILTIYFENISNL